MIYEMNSKGESVPLSEYLAERNERMFAEVDKKAHEIKITSGKMRGSRLATCLFAFLAKEPMMSRSNYANLDVTDLSAYFCAYMEMLEHYNYYEPSNTKQLFSAYIGVTVAKFNDLMDASDPDLKEKAVQISDIIDGMIFAQAESSQNNASATLQRSRIKGAGQGHTMAQDDINLLVTPQTDPKIMIERAKQLVLEAQNGGKR